MALLDYQNGQLSSAKDRCEKVLKKVPNTGPALHCLSLILMLEGDVDRASSLMERAVTVNPDSAPDWSLLGNLQQECGKRGAAVAAYNRALDLDPKLSSARYNLAGMLLDDGQLISAKVHFELLIKANKDDPECHHGLALIMLELGDMVGSRQELDRALSLDPSFTTGWYDLGNWHRKNNEFMDAVAAYEHALKIDPNYPAAHNNVGNCYLQMGDYSLARYHLEKSAMLRPTGQAYMSLASLFGLLEDWDGQRAACDSALSLSSDDLEIFLAAGELAVDRDDFDKAELIFTRAQSLWPDSPPILTALAKTLLRSGRSKEALKLCEYAVTLDPSFADAHLNLGVARQFLGEHDAAITAFERAISLDQFFVEAYNNLGVTYADLGKFEEAYKCFDRALSIDPDSVLVLASLLNSRKNTPDSGPQVEHLSRLASSRSFPLSLKVAMHFALGKAYDDLQAYDKAFANYEEGNRLKSEVAPFNREAHSQRINNIIETFNADCFEALKDVGQASDIPVFVVGMPRSGTTLVESIIASHSQAAGAGELRDIYSMVRDFGKKIGSSQHYPAAVHELRRSAVDQLANSYLSTLKGVSDTALRVVDKMPNNFLHLGLITLLLPNAKIIHCRRYALDVCLSNYFQMYAYALNFSYNFEDLAFYYKQYQDLMMHWQHLLPVSIFECDYEELVNNQEATSRKIIDYCQLPWEPNCLAFHKTSRTVQTASHWQVRQPMYRSSSGRWRYYAPYIDTLRSALEREGCQL